MCNIAGYAGAKQAAPILLDMLRRQEAFDAEMSTGIATIYDGKLHYRKVIGNVDTLIRETDAFFLPGTVGIAHSRPFGRQGTIPMHPNLNPDETMALITNGTTPACKYCAQWDAAADLLAREGYSFVQRTPGLNESPRLSSCGDNISPAEMRVLLIDLYIKQGMTITAAMAKACADMYSDNASVMIHQDYPTSIFALRTTRPVSAVLENGEAYIATTNFGFPEQLRSEPIMLPLFHTCVISKDGIRISADKMDIEPVSEMTPYTYAEAYRRFERILKSGKDIFFDDLEIAADTQMRDLWEGDHTFVQHARLVYDMLWQFHKEGRLSKELRTQQIVPDGLRHRWYFSLND